MKTICIDPGHGMSNKSSGVFDTGAVSDGFRESDIVMEWANVLRGILMKEGHRVVRTRVDHKDPAPVGQRAKIAKQYGCEVMVSLHCNAANGKATGTEVFYRGDANYTKAKLLSVAISKTLGIKDRGPKTENQSQHTKLAVLDFNPCWLIELGFIDNPEDRKKMTTPGVVLSACEEIAKIITK